MPFCLKCSQWNPSQINHLKMKHIPSHWIVVKTLRGNGAYFTDFFLFNEKLGRVCQASRPSQVRRWRGTKLVLSEKPALLLCQQQWWTEPLGQCTEQRGRTREVQRQVKGKILCQKNNSEVTVLERLQLLPHSGWNQCFSRLVPHQILAFTLHYSSVAHRSGTQLVWASPGLGHAI